MAKTVRETKYVHEGIHTSDTVGGDGVAVDSSDEWMCEQARTCETAKE